MGLFEGRQRKEWRAALDTARRAESVGNIAQVQRSIRAALALRSAVPQAWLDNLREMLAGYESSSYGQRALTFAALRAESSLDLELAMQWHSALGDVEEQVRRVEGLTDNVDLDPVLQSIQSVLSLGVVIPWEMKEVDIPPVWEQFIQLAELVAKRPGGVPSALRALAAALPLAESLPPQCARQLSQVASTLVGRSLSSPNRKEFSRITNAAAGVATRAADQSPWSRPNPTTTQQPPWSRTAAAASDESFSVQVVHALEGRRFGEVSRLVLSGDPSGRSVPEHIRELPRMAPWTSVVSDMNLSEPPGCWDRSQAGKIRIQWAAQMRRPSLTCVVATVDGHPKLIAEDGVGDPGAGLSAVPIELAGSLEECVAWGQRILNDRRLYVALLDAASAWSPTTTLDDITEFLTSAGTPPVELAKEPPLDSHAVPRLGQGPGEATSVANWWEAQLLSESPLDDTASTALRMFILNANLTVGSWGPFKGIVKALESRAHELPTEFGSALARIAFLPAADSLPLDEAASLIATGPVGGRRTLNYLDRRGRRALRTLSWRDPAAYTVVVRAFLGGVDSLLADGRRIERRHALDFALYGAVRPGAPHQRFPGPPSMPQRHQQRWDPAPDAWRGNSAEVSALLADTTTSPDIATWAFQVLTDLGADVPVVHTEPALLAGNSDLQQQGAAAATADPATVKRLAPEALATLMVRLPAQDSAPLMTGWFPEGHLQSAFEALLVDRSRLPHLDVTASDEKRVVELFVHLKGRVNLSTAARLAALRSAILWGQTADLTALSSELSFEQLADLREDLGSVHEGDAARWLDDTIVQMAPSSQWQAYLHADRWVDLPDPELSALGWRLASLYYQDDDSNFLTFVQRHGGSPAAVARSVTRLAAGGSVSQVSVVLGWWARTADPKSWRNSVAAVDRALAASPQVWPHLWPILGEGVDPSTAVRVRELPSLAQGMVDSTAPSSIATLDERQTDALWSFLTAHPQRFAADDEFALAVTLVPNAALCSTAISILRSQNRIKDMWLPLIESGLPPAVQAGDLYLRSVTTRESLRAAVLDLLDSDNSDARHLAMTLLSSNGVGLSLVDVLVEMTEHRDPSIWREVAQRLESLDDRAKRESFEREVLTTRRRGRSAKTLVQQHLDSPGNVEHVAGLLDVVLPLAQGNVPRDMEWALGQLVTLSESGQPIPGLTVIEEAG